MSDNTPALGGQNKITNWPEKGISGAKRANLTESGVLSDWFFGWGKDRICQFEGSWWDMICFARNVLSSENTQIAAPEFYMPHLRVKHYLGDEPYEFVNEDDTRYPKPAKQDKA